MTREIARFIGNCIQNKDSQNEFEKNLVTNGKIKKNEFSLRMKDLSVEEKEGTSVYKIYTNIDGENEIINDDDDDDFLLLNATDNNEIVNDFLFLDETDRLISNHLNDNNFELDNSFNFIE